MNFNSPCNPWINVNNYFYSGDWEQLRPALKSKLSANATFPEPYSGNPNSRVVCLNYNPGERDLLFESNPRNVALYAKLTKRTLLGKAKGSMWYQMKDHAGYCWLMDKTKELWNAIGREPQIFMIEYFPYHSPNGLRFPASLPSYTFNDCLVKEAIVDSKIIIIMRHEKEWYNRIPMLQSYSRLIVLKSPQSGRITKGNIDISKSRVSFCQLINQL